MLDNVHENYYPIQIADLGYLAVPAEKIAMVLADRSKWSEWFPDLKLQITEDRGDLGLRWLASGKVVGTSEIWLEKSHEGTFVHYFLHGEPTGKIAAPKVTMFYRLRFKNLMNELRRILDSERPIGEKPKMWRKQTPTTNR